MEANEKKKGFVARLTELKKSFWSWFALLLVLDFVYYKIFAENSQLYPKAIWTGFVLLTIVMFLTLILAVAVTLFRFFFRKKEKDSS